MELRRLAQLNTSYMDMDGTPLRDRIPLPEIVMLLMQKEKTELADRLSKTFVEAIQVLESEKTLFDLTLLQQLQQIAEDGSQETLPKTLSFYALVKRIKEEVAAGKEPLLTEEEYIQLVAGVKHVLGNFRGMKDVVKVCTVLSLEAAEKVEPTQVASLAPSGTQPDLTAPVEDAD